MANELLDAMATAIFTVALRDKQAGELLQCLFEGGSATVDNVTGKLVMINGDQLNQMINKT